MKKNNLLIIILLIVVLVLGFIFALRVLTYKSVEDGMDYVEENVSKEREKLDIENEKEKIRTAIISAMLGNNTLNPLTYDSFDKQLKDTFGSGKYNLTGPNYSGEFTLKINTRTYTIDSGGRMIE